GVQNRHPLELELHSACRAEAPLEVELDLGSVEPPGAVAFGARREEERRQRQAPLSAVDEDVLSRAACRSGRNLEPGFVEADRLLRSVEDRVLSEHDGVRAFVRDAAA